MRKCLFALAGVLALLAVPAAGRAARVEADPNKEYVISPEAGPFVILAHAYGGDDARALANRLALHLRQYGWPAYVYDYTPEEERKAKEWIDARYHDVPPEARPHKTIRVTTQWGVLIGGYSDFDSASADISKVKKTPEPPRDNVIDAELIDPVTKQIYHLNTYAQCIATRNPTVRLEQADRGAPDPAWKNLNAGRPYNLLKCGKPWTLAVKQFQGAQALQPRSAGSEFLNMVGLGGRSTDVLEASARQAEEMAKFMNDNMHIKAFVLHTRTGSIVTVGAYDRNDDRDLQDLAKKLAGFRFGRTADAIQLFTQPLPMKVPQL